MSIGLTVDELLEYTDWERGKWHERLKQSGDQVLGLAAGPHGDGRFESLGDLVRHIFSAEKRYVERLTNRPLTDTASISNSEVDALFQFGKQSRKDLREFIATFPSADWDVMKQLKVLTFDVAATPRKIVIHTLMHEIRHWAQIGTILRLNGLVGEFHDFLGSPVMGGGFHRE